MECVNLFEFERNAAERIPKMAYDYFFGGSGDQVTLRENRTAYEHIKLRPRVMVGVHERHSKVEILGKPHHFPLLIAPMGFIAMAHPEGELAIARAAGAMGITMVLSTMSTYSIEEVAEAASAPLWFQLYVYKDRGVTRELVARAEAAGYEALMLTVDTPLLGRREQDVRNRFRLPDGLYAKNLLKDNMGEIAENAQTSALATYIASLWDASLSWQDVAWLRSITKLPIIVKGILRGDDAVLALEHGASAIVVSNHGGRQLDTVPATIEVLPEVVEAVDNRADVLIDGGVRRGTDMIKALAYGAKGVLLGRPILWGLGCDGEDGVKKVLSLLRDEFDLAMALCGCREPGEISRDLIWEKK